MTPQGRSLERRIERLEAIFAAERLEQERELETQVGQKGRIQVHRPPLTPRRRSPASRPR